MAKKKRKERYGDKNGLTGAIVQITLVPHGYEITASLHRGRKKVEITECRDYSANIKSFEKALLKLHKTVKGLA